MVQQQRNPQESQSSPAFVGHDRKPPSEKPSSALFRIISPGGSSRELPLRCGEEAQVLNRRVKLESVSPMEDGPAGNCLPNAVLSISYPDRTTTATYPVDLGKQFPFGDHTFKLVEVH
jgi:hypothetical protein